MSTRSTIGIRHEDGSVTKIYCHWDGYIEWNGAILQKYYNTAEKVEKLLALGNLSSLGPEIGPDDPKAWDINTESDDRLCRTYTSRGEKWEQASPSQLEEYNYLFDESEGLWTVECETVKKPGKAAKSLGFEPLYCSYETHFLIDRLADLPEKSWKGMAPKNEKDWGVTLEECMDAAREARAPINQRKADHYNAYYSAYCD